jgi:acetylxylan esterase
VSRSGDTGNRCAVVVAMFMCMLVNLLTVNSPAADLVEIKEFGPNPTKLKMFLYEPDGLPQNAPVMVGVHWCHGTARNFFTGNQYRSLADTHKFTVIYPQANSPDSCFDVHSKETLAHDGGGDALGIASMVRYIIKSKSVDASRVFAAGHSSGGMMCNVLAGSYPDLFKAVSASAGVPFGCFGGGTSSWNESCAKGKIVRTGKEWGDLVRAAYPEYSGIRPRVQMWHGMKDDVLAFVNFEEAIKQWTNVLGVSATASSTEANPRPGYTRMRFVDSSGTVQLEAIKAADQTHNVSIVDLDVIRFFGLDRSPTAIGHTTPNTALEQCRITVRHVGGHISLQTRPGNIGVKLFALDGSIIRSVPQTYCADGRRTIQMGERSGVPSTALYILAVTVDGVTSAEKHLFRIAP